MDAPIDILLFVEDPGAANCIIGLPGALAEIGYSARLFCQGPAVDYLRSRQVAACELSVETTADSLLSVLRPRLLAVGTASNPHSLGLALIQVARRRNIASVALLDSALNAGYRFRGETQDPLYYLPQWLLCPDEATRQAFLALGVRPDAIRLIGHPQLDRVLARRRELSGLDRGALRREFFPGLEAGRRVGVFVAEPSYGPGAIPYRKTGDYTLHGRGAAAGRSEIVIEEFLDAARLRDDLYLVLRLHPKQDPRELAAYLPEFDQLSRKEPPLDLIWAADFAAGLTSMLLYEAAALGVPTLSIVPRPMEQSWLPSVERGWTPVVWERLQLRARLAALVALAVNASARPLRLEAAGAIQSMAAFFHELLAGKPVYA